MTVKISGAVSLSPTGSIFLNSYNIKIITNYNELTHHHLKVIKSHLLRTRGKLTAKTNKSKKIVQDDLMVDDEGELDELEDPISALERDIMNLLKLNVEVSFSELESTYGAKYSGENINGAVVHLYEMEKIYSPKNNVFRAVV